MKKYILVDEQIPGRSFGGGIAFDSLAEVKEILVELAEQNLDEDYDFDNYPIRKLLDITGYTIEEIEVKN